MTFVNPLVESVIPILSELVEAAAVELASLAVKFEIPVVDIIKAVVKLSAGLPPSEVFKVELTLVLKKLSACGFVEVLKENDPEFAVEVPKVFETLVFSTLFKLTFAVVLEIETAKYDNEDCDGEADDELLTLLVIEIDAVIEVLLSRLDHAQHKKISR